MYRIIFTNHFKRQLKKLVKKDKNLKKNLLLALGDFTPASSIDIGRGVFKIRIAGQSKGKSGGYRIYLFVIEVNNVLTPICIYSKSEKESITAKEMTGHFYRVREELEDLI